MNLSELSLRRPVLAVVCSIVIVIFGAIGFKYLSVREYPAIDPAVINVRTSYIGANADIIEQQITEPLEKVVNGVQGVKNITSTSAQGSAQVGHHDRQGGGTNPTSWNSAHPSKGCSQENLVATGGAGRYYCFAVK